MEKNLAIGYRIADAAAYFDSAKNFLPEQSRAEAARQVDLMHICAATVAGLDSIRIYAPTDKKFDTNKIFSSKVVIGTDCEIDISHLRAVTGHVSGSICVNHGPLSFLAFPTPTEARLLALALLQAADEMDASTAQGIRDHDTQQVAA